MFWLSVNAQNWRLEISKMRSHRKKWWNGPTLSWASKIFQPWRPRWVWVDMGWFLCQKINFNDPPVVLSGLGVIFYVKKHSTSTTTVVLSVFGVIFTSHAVAWSNYSSQSPQPLWPPWPTRPPWPPWLPRPTALTTLTTLTNQSAMKQKV